MGKLMTKRAKLQRVPHSKRASKSKQLETNHPEQRPCGAISLDLPYSQSTPRIALDTHLLKGGQMESEEKRAQGEIEPETLTTDTQLGIAEGRGPGNKNGQDRDAI